MITLEENVPLATLTTLGVGGPARLLTRAATIEHVRRALTFASEKDLSVFLLGAGSNVLFPDEGFPGLVLCLQLRGVEVRREDSTVLVKASAGEEWDSIVRMAVERGWAGIECLSGIPGLVGATPIQNVGAYGQEVASSIVEVEVYDRRRDAVSVLQNEACAFRYRNSRFKSDEPDRFVVLSVTFRLDRAGKPTISYADLRRRLDERSISDPTLADVRETVLSVRRAKGMVIDSNDPDSRSAGSFFMNPLLAPEALRRLKDAIDSAGLDPESLPVYPSGSEYKVPAAWLIERAGFERGMAFGNAGISTKHALAIVNRGGATSREILELMSRIRDTVAEKFGVRLVPEPLIVHDA